VNAPLIHVELPLVTKLLNPLLRMHWHARKKYQRKLAWEMRIAILSAGFSFPAQPLARARLRIERRSIGMPDYDGMVGGYKHLIDCLLPASSRHPCGLGIIADDNPDCLVSDYPPPSRVARPMQRTVVTIWDLAGSAP
jgi:hypothetical protein